MWHYVYVLKNAKGKLYKGFTTNVKHRLIAHNRGEVPYTSANRPWSLIHVSAFPNKQNAQKFEKYLKSGSGRSFLKRHFL